MIIHDHEQNTLEWLASRLGIPTASRAKDLLTSTGSPSKSVDRYAEELAIELYTGAPSNSFQGNAHTEFGNEMEPKSRAWYAFERDVDPVSVGFITDDLRRFGCSPDDLIGDSGLAEYKNLPVGHVKVLLYWAKNNKPPTDYIMQCHMQMLVTDRAWCDLVYYSETLPRLICRIERDANIDDALKQQITVCLQKRDEILAILETYERPEVA